MSEIIQNRLSADSLYTFTQNKDTLKLILENGIRHSINKEIIPYKGVVQQNFIACFCDILPEQSDYHRSIYGTCGIALKKEWGIQNGVSPVRYIHQNSFGASEGYLQSKFDFRNARQIIDDGGNVIDYINSIVCMKVARDKGLFIGDNISVEMMSNPELAEFMKDFDKDFERLRSTLGDATILKIFDTYLRPILNGLEQTFDELEKRDTFVRIYEGEFRDIPSKIFYDEREWRSVKFAINQSINTSAMNKGFLPEEYNLKFQASDVSYILVKTEDEKKEIKNFISEKLSYLEGTEKVVLTFSEHLENT